MTWTPPKTDWVTGNLVAASNLNEIGADLAYLLTPNSFLVNENTGTYTTTSTTAVNVGANYSVSITTYGGHLVVGASGILSMSAGTGFLVIDIDGTDVTMYQTANANADYRGFFSFILPKMALLAGLHTVSLQFYVNNVANTATITKTYAPLIFWGIEL
jgi:hypothetical protein